MAITIARLTHIINIAAHIISLALIALSVAVIYLSSHGMERMNAAFPAGDYEWYRGPDYDPRTKHNITLKYDSANEGVILAAAAVSCLAGLVGMAAIFFPKKVCSYPTY